MPIPVAIALVENQGRYLIGPRSGEVPLAGFWEFPGGKILPHESPAEAAERECREETGLLVRARGVRYRTTHRYDHGVVDLSFLDCELLDPAGGLQPRPPFRWVAATDLNHYPFPAANDAILRRLTSGEEPTQG